VNAFADPFPLELGEAASRCNWRRPALVLRSMDSPSDTKPDAEARDLVEQDHDAWNP